MAVKVSPHSARIITDTTDVCSDTYILKDGDTLGSLAQRCGITLNNLLSANPYITNPNSVASGDQVNIPRLAGRGGGSDLTGEKSLQQNAYVPGSVINVYVDALPPGASVKIGLGMSQVGYRVMQREMVGADGILSVSLIIPEDAIPGDSAFILVSGNSVPSFQVISPQFEIGW